jgi:hypothetical protein
MDRIFFKVVIVVRLALQYNKSQLHSYTVLMWYVTHPSVSTQYHTLLSYRLQLVVKALQSTIYTVIRFVWVSAKFGTCTVVSVNGKLVEAKMCTFTRESTHFIFNKCPKYTHDGASAKFSTNSHETGELVFLNLYGAQESMPRHQLRQPM